MGNHADGFSKYALTSPERKARSSFTYMSRSPAWRLMATKHGKAARDFELVLILSQPANFLQCMGRQHAFATNLLAIPGDLIPLLCCITSELFGTAPRIVAQGGSVDTGIASSYAQGLCHLYQGESLEGGLRCTVTMVVNNFLADAGQGTDYGGPDSCLKAPAVLHFLKSIVIGPKDVQPLDPVATSCVIRCLRCLLSFVVVETTARKNLLLSIHGREVNSDAAGLPLHLNPLLSTQVLKTDILLLHELGSHMLRDANQRIECCQVQGCILQIWSAACTLYPLPSATHTAMVSSVIGVAKQCALHGLLLMKSLRKAGRHLPHKDPDAQQQQRQQKQQQHGYTASLSSTESHLKDVTAVRALRGLLFLTSGFDIEKGQEGHIHLHAGKSWGPLCKRTAVVS